MEYETHNNLLVPSKKIIPAEKSAPTQSQGQMTVSTWRKSTQNSIQYKLQAHKKKK